MFKTILAATDGSDHGTLAVALAADLAEKYDAKFTLLNVVDNREPTPHERHLAEIEYGSVSAGIRETLAEGVLEKAARSAKLKGAKRVETRVEFGDAAPVILATAKECGADLIVLGSRGLSDLRGLMMGSVSHKVANLAEVTVLTVK